MIVRYSKIAELGDLTLTWRNAAGAVIDFATGYTFELKVGTPGKTVDLTKSSGISGGSTSPNVTVTFTPAELDALDAGRYTAQLRARQTSTNRDRVMSFWLYILDAVL